MNTKSKKIVSLILASFLLVSCQSQGENHFTDDDPLRLDLQNEKLTILQLTDTHLSFGIDYNDQRTFKLIAALVEYTNPDIVVFTGDQTMAPFGPQLFNRLCMEMDKMDVYWTFVFGNHDNDHSRYEDYFKFTDQYDKLLFKVGPELTEGGFGNFKIETYYDDTPFYQLYMLDTHSEVGGEMAYGWLSEAQVNWYDTHAESDKSSDVKSSIFIHIPLMEYLDFTEEAAVDGVKGEGIYHQGMNTGLFDVIVEHGVTQGVFVGHDHLNNFSFLKDNVLLAYGQASGYNGYGNTNKGGRLIEIDATKTMTTQLILDTEVGV